MELRYRYTPLSTTKSTRIIEVLPALTPPATVIIKLHETRIDQPIIPYEAVSYTWGDQTPDQPIECHQQRLYVTENANDILRRLRRPRRSRFIWIDAICIDQTCEQDKHGQIAMMADVYRMAEQVVVWLGNVAPELPSLYQAIRTRLESSSSLDPPGDRILSMAPSDSATNPSSNFHIPPSQVPLEDLKKMVAHALDEVLLHPYWQRVWTAQEFLLNQNCSLHFHNGRISKEEFRELLQISKDRVRLFRVVHLATWLTETTRQPSGGPAPSTNSGFDEISSIFECLPRLRSHLPADRVFALVSVYPRLLGDVTIDYRRKPSEVYTEAAMCIVRKTGHLSILSFAGSDQGGKVADLPSWVPDWSTRRASLRVGGRWLKHVYRRISLADSMPSSFDGRGVKLRATRRPVRDDKGGLRDDDSGCFKPDFDLSRAMSEGILLVKGVFVAEVSDAVSDVMEDSRGVALTAEVFYHSLALFLSTCTRKIGPESLKDQLITCMECFEKYFKDYARWTQASDLARQMSRPEETLMSPQESATGALREWVGTCVDELTMGPEMIEGEQQHRVTSYLKRRGTQWESTANNLRRFDGHLEMVKDPETKFRFYSSCQRVFMTTDGTLGISERVEQGDKVALVAGCDKPFIIRQDIDAQPEFKRYRLIGEAYLNGVQDGRKWPASDKETGDIFLV